MSVTSLLLKLLGRAGRKVKLPKVPSYKVSSPYPVKTKGAPGVSIDKSYRSEYSGYLGYPPKTRSYPQGQYSDDFPYFNQWSPSIGRRGGRSVLDMSPHAGKIFGKQGAVYSPNYTGRTMLPSSGQRMNRFAMRGPEGDLIYEPARYSSWMMKGRMPEYYERFPIELLEKSWATRNPTLLQNFIKRGYGGVGPGQKLDMMARRAFPKPGIGDKLKRLDILAGRRLPNPLRVKTLDSISDMRRNPGIGAGLQKLESRKASALSSGGRGAMGAGRSAKPARPLKYEPSTKRNFINMLRTDKNFEKFVVDMVGPENVTKIMNNPKIRKTLVSDYLRTVRTRVDNFPPHPDVGTPATIDEIMKMFGG